MEHDEKSLLLDKSYTCPVCDKKVKAKAVKTNSARFVDTCSDLRPIHSNINVTKYDVVSCSNCGYTALTKNFSTTTQVQRKLLREKIQSHFKSHDEPEYDYYSTDLAISRLKMALLCTVSKMGKESEIGNICLKISWLYQDLIDELSTEDLEYNQKKQMYSNEADNAAMNALEHLSKARMQESFPIAGMNEVTLDYLLSYLMYKKGDYAPAMKFLSGVVTSSSASPRLKEKALELKELLHEHLHGDE